MADLKITIKGIPEKELNLVWNDVLQFAIKTFGEVITPSNDIVLNYKNMQPESFYQILGSALTEQALSTAEKINAKS